MDSPTFPAAPTRAAGGAAAPSAPVLDRDVESLVTEDDTPVDNMPSEKQQRLLTEPFVRSRWLRWTDAQGELIPTGKEAAERERRRERLEALLRRAGRG